MSSPRRLVACLVTGLMTNGLMAGCLPAVGHAADLTPAQATDLEAQLRGWLASLVSPALDVGPRPIQVSADGDHFNVVVPMPDLVAASGMLPAGLSVKLKAKPLDGGRWALDDLLLPSPVRFTPPAGSITQKPGEPAPDISKMGGEVSIATQEYHGIFDPSYATTSSFDTKWTGFRIATSTSTTVTARSVGHSTWQPAGDGKINVLSEGASEQSDSTIITSDGKTVHYTTDRTKSSSRINAVSPASLGALARSIAALLPTLPDTKDSLSPTQRTLARTAVFALRDMFAGAEANQSFEGIKFSADGHTGTLARAGLGTKMGVVDGKLELSTLVSLEGLSSPEVPAGVYRDYLPRKIVIKPRVSGIPSEDLVKLMLRAIDSDANDMAELQGSAMALLGAGPLEFSIDELSVDLGKASLSGTGSLDVASMTDITGEAEITVKGLDALIKAANTTPELKQMAPVLIFLKGIGKQDGGDTVWNINYEDNKVTVNDTDLSDLIPSDKSPPANSKKK